MLDTAVKYAGANPTIVSYVQHQRSENLQRHV
jgi:hypothetical protein